MERFLVARKIIEKSLLVKSRYFGKGLRFTFAKFWCAMFVARRFWPKWKIVEKCYFCRDIGILWRDYRVFRHFLAFILAKRMIKSLLFLVLFKFLFVFQLFSNWKAKNFHYSMRITARIIQIQRWISLVWCRATFECTTHSLTPV